MGGVRPGRRLASPRGELYRRPPEHYIEDQRRLGYEVFGMEKEEDGGWVVGSYM